ncbi:neopullulanase [Spirosomataceae bacterium TFI 002]|nr:neopullulanase [Spirosomataceae bacterium TFI 002]
MKLRYSICFGLLWLSFFLITKVSFGQKIKRIEPANWWIGMKNPTVQVMIYGDKVADYKVSISSKNIKLVQSHKVENPNYLFLDLLITKNAKPEIVEITIGKTKVNFELKARATLASHKEGFNTSDVIYLITPDRFANGDKSNDNLAGYPDLTNQAEFGRHGGDIQGMINHLDYIQKMGFTAIWPMPLEENNMPQWSYHGYAITDFYKIDPRFGSNELYVKLSKEAKAKGIKIIKDVVLNHCGVEHWWMKDLPSSDWINYGGKFTNTNHKREVLRDIHASESDKKIFNDGWFVASMPDLNQRNPFMANYIIQNSLWWIETADLGGFRVDTYPYSDPDFASQWSKRIMDEYPNCNITSEEWSTNPAITSYWQMGKQNSNGYKSYVPSPMDFPLQNALINSLKEDESWNNGLVKIYESVTNDFLYADASKLLIFGDNHDMSRVFTQLDENVEHTKMALALLATMRGIPQFYYGTEILMSNPNSDSHGEIRGDFPGGFDGMKANAQTQMGLTNTQIEVQDYLKELLNYRKSNSALHDGKMIHFAPENGVYVYFRINSDRKVMVILNKNEKAMTLDLSRFKEVLDRHKKAYDAITKEAHDLSKPFKLHEIGATVLELE